jgi:hypothetical protein
MIVFAVVETANTITEGESDFFFVFNVSRNKNI